MEITETKAPPAPPNIITAIRSGFDVIANRIYIILIPVLLDMWLWLGPHLQLKSLMTNYLDALASIPGFGQANSGISLPTDPEMWQAVIERINLMTFLRSYPIGVFSLMSGILPLQTPTGSPFFVDVASPISVILFWIFLTLVGIVVGTFYFILIAQAAIEKRVNWKKALQEWPSRIPQVILLSILIVLVLLILLIPASCMLSFVSMGGIPISQIAIIILMGMVLWVLFPLVFTPQGIFVLKVNLLVAVQRSVMIVRMTLPTTAIFFLAILVTGQGLDILWRVPAESSWFAIIGVAGHAFVSSALLAATFIYYQDANAWVQNIIRKMQLSEAK